MTVGERIKARRKTLNMTQYELATKIGYSSRSSINKIELGINDITQSKIVEIAKALDTSPAYIMGWEAEAVCNVGSTYNENEKQIIEKYRQLNQLGKEKATEYITDLSDNPKYTI